MASHAPRAIFSCVPSEAPVPLALHQLWLSRRWQFLHKPRWFHSCLCLPALHLQDRPGAGHIPGGAAPLGLERAGRVPEMGQGRAGAEPRRGEPASGWWLGRLCIALGIGMPCRRLCCWDGASVGFAVAPCRAGWGSSARKAAVRVSGGARAWFGVRLACHARGCAVASAELPPQWPGAVSVPESSLGGKTAAGVQLLLLGAIGYLTATCYRELYYCGDPGALVGALGESALQG